MNARQLDFSTRYRALFGGSDGTLDWRFEIDATQPDALVMGVTVIPFVGEHVVCVESVDGACALPGGHRDPGEAIERTAARELLEEAGAHLDGFHPFGGARVHSRAAAPARPDIPHPDYVRLAAWAEVTLIGPPATRRTASRSSRYTSARWRRLWSA